MKRLWLLFLGKGAASSLLSGWGQGPLLEDILTYSQRQAERGKGAWRVIPSARGGVTADTIAGPVGDLPTSSRLASSPARVLGGRGPGGGVRGARWPRPRTPRPPSAPDMQVHGALTWRVCVSRADSDADASGHRPQTHRPSGGGAHRPRTRGIPDKGLCSVNIC